MNWKFRNHSDVPPRGYQYVDPDTGHTITGNSYSQWQSRIVDHRRANNLPPLDPLVAEDQNCGKLDAGSCQMYCESTDPAIRSVHAIGLHWSDIVRGTKTIASFKLAGSPLVSQEEANRRAAICAKCPFKVNYTQPCGYMCGELFELVNSLVGGAKTDHIEQMEACGVCHCSLPAKVWLPLPILEKFETPEISAAYPDFCWMRGSS